MYYRIQWRALVNAAMNYPVPQKAENVLTSCATICFSGRNLLLGVLYLLLVVIKKL
jgi:hypothetical protein